MIEQVLDKTSQLNEVTKLVNKQLEKVRLKSPRPYSTKYDKVVNVNEQNPTIYNESLQEVTGEVSYLTNKFRNLLQSQLRQTWLRNQQSGGLDSKKLNRLVSANYINRSSNLSIFKKREQKQTLKSAVTVLLDTSSSMNLEDALTSTVTICEPLSKLGIETEIIGYSTRGNHLNQAQQELNKSKSYILKEYTRVDNLLFEIYKTFHEQFPRKKYNLGSFTKKEYTPIFEAIEFAGRRLFNYKKQKAYKRFLFIITDGLPYMRTAHHHLPLMLNMVEQRVNELARVGITTCAIGVGAPYVQQLFQHSVIAETGDYHTMSLGLINKLMELYNV